MESKEKKKSFIIYTDYEDNFNMLSDEELGKLIRIIMKYEKTQENPNITQENPIVQMAFSFIKGNLDRDRAKYNASITNGKKGGRPKKNNSKETKHKPSKNLNDIVIGIDNVIDNEIVIVSVIDLFEKEFARPLSPIEMQSIIELQNDYSDDLIKFSLSESIKNGVRNIRYIERILQNWKSKGVKSVFDAKKITQEFSEKGKQSIIQTWEQAEEETLSDEERERLIKSIKGEK